MASNPYSKLYDVEMVGGDQRQRLAEILRSQGMNQPQGQMISGWYVPPSWSQNLNAAMQMGLGTYMGIAGEEERNKKFADIMRRRKEGIEIPQEQKPTVFNNLEGVEGRTPAAVVQPELNKIQELAGRQQPSTEQSMANPAVMQQTQQPKYRPMTQDELDENLMQAFEIDPRKASALASLESTRAAREETRALKAEERAWREREAEKQRQFLASEHQLTRAIALSGRTPASEKPLTEFQGKAMTFGTRAAEADKILANTQFNPVSVEAVRKTGIIGNMFAAPETQKALQAQRDFVNAVLRQESGAAISQGEFENAQKQYFPQPGDTPEVIAQKAKNRQTQIMGFARQAGPNGGRDVISVLQTPYAMPQTQQAPAQQNRLGGLTPPNTQVKFLGFE